MHLFDRGTRINDRKLVLATRLFRKSQARICGRAKHHNEVSPVHSITRGFGRRHRLVAAPSMDESTISTAKLIVASMSKQPASAWLMTARMCVAHPHLGGDIGAERP
jgi:hypothetical protein